MKAFSNQALANCLHHALALSGADEAQQTLAMLPSAVKLPPSVAPDNPRESWGAGFEFNFDLNRGEGDE